MRVTLILPRQRSRYSDLCQRDAERLQERQAGVPGKGGSNIFNNTKVIPDGF
jgi:hypothetical protein